MHPRRRGSSFASFLLFLCSVAALSLFGGCGDRSSGVTSTAEPIAHVEQELVKNFAVGSLVVPMDTTYQNSGTLKAYGLVYALLRAGVPVDWAIKPGKAQGGVDFTASATDVQTAAVITNHGYRAGPFVIDSADRAAAMPIVTAWQAGNTTSVHDVTAPFSADVRRTLTAAPRIAVFVDGNEDIAFRYLNAAGIRDSLNQTWPSGIQGNYAAWPDVLTPATIRGATVGGAPDGYLLRPDGTPRYCQVTSMHYATPADNEIVRELRAWLAASSLTHAFMECHATIAFENAVAGRYLTTQGMIDDGATPSPVTNRVPDSPFSQYDGNFTALGGSVNSMGVPNGSALRATDTTLINLSSAGLSSRVVWMTGFLDGDPTKGKVSYLAGHEYPTNLPISSNPATNGVRLFLNSLFESNCAEATQQPNVTLTKTAPASVTESTLTYTLTYTNAGAGVADSAQISDVIPTGATFASATGGGTLSGNTVTWSLGNLAPGASGSVTLTVNLPTNATYTNAAQLDYKVSVTPKSVKSNSVTTTRTSTPIANLSITATDAPDPVAAGGTISYTVNVSNAGPQAAPSVVVTLTVPAGGTYVSSTGTGWSCSSAAGAVTCTLASAAVGAAPALTVDVKAPSGPATAISTIAVSSAATDPVAGNNTTSASTTVQGPSVDGGTDGGADAGLLDSDGDGLPDVEERRIGTDANDADSDDDGVPDGAEPSYDKDSDGDGLVNALDPDSDNDGLFDGTELGQGCSDAGTNVTRGRCIPDADPATKTDPLDADTDDGGAKDGAEDANLNGRVDAGETTPVAGNGGDDAKVVDSDGDGLSDALEATLGSDPKDADTDDDGVPDGAEPNPSDDVDRDGLKGALDADSDDDGLFDGTEMGFGCSSAATNTARGRCRADADGGTTKTSPLLWDTDGGGASDGAEDPNLDGAKDTGETDPTVGHGGDDGSVADSDDDGLSDAQEAKLGSDPNDADSDDDGLIDGKEPNPGVDDDGDGKANILDADSDGDGLFDGTEAGKDCAGPGTNASNGSCIADADPTTTTFVLVADTDRGGVKDGDEDTNHDGKVDPGERDPNVGADDNKKICSSDGDCGGPTSGQVCVDRTCTPGCRGQGGNGCPAGQRCTSTTDAVGTCEPDIGGQDGGTSSSSGGSALDDGRLAGGGCGCSVPARTGARASGGLAAIAAIAAAARRRKRSTERDAR